VSLHKVAVETTHIHKHTYTHRHLHTQTHKHEYTHAHVCMHTQVHIHAHICTHFIHVHTHAHTQTTLCARSHLMICCSLFLSGQVLETWVDGPRHVEVDMNGLMTTSRKLEDEEDSTKSPIQQQVRIDNLCLCLYVYVFECVSLCSCACMHVCMCRCA
jgi:hypothetical protein